MPRPKNDHIEKTAKVIFKSSRNSTNTYSKTYSGMSQAYSKSLILRLKQNLPNGEYYEVNGSVKRDLSIETDICILRGYYKKRRNRFINRGTVSTKSKYSLNRTEIDTIDEFKYDSSACGDSKGSFKYKNGNFNIHLTSLVIENLKKLLKDWIKKYLLDNGITEEENMETVLDSILHKLDLQTKETISSCTYTVDIEVVDQKQNQISQPAKSRAIKQESVSVPLSGKSLRILSTLSVPRNMNRPKTSKCCWNKLNKMRHNKILLSTNGSSKYLFNSSSLNFLILPTKFLTKRCTTYQQDIPGKNEDQQKSLIQPEESLRVKNLDNFATIATSSALDTIPSINKNIYKNLKRDEIYDSTSNNQNRKTKHEQNNNESLLSIDFLNQRFVSNNNNITQEKLPNSHLMKASIDRKAKKNTRRSKKITSRLRKHKSIKSKTHNQQEKELSYHFQSIFKIISSYKCGKDIKLDIHVNVFSSSDCKAEKDAAQNCKYSYPIISANVMSPANPETMNESHHHNIIPLLDGAASQAKYILSGETSKESSDNNKDIESPSIIRPAKNSQIAQEISELKIIIKSLANTTERFINEHLSNRSTNKVISKHHENQEYLAKPSIGVQFSNNFVKDDVFGSGIKLKKDPKKKQKEYNPHLMKRSTSYNLIDSESILKVTDMTSAVQGEINVKERVDRALTCSLPKTKSLFEVSLEKCDEKLLAFRCNDLTNPREFIYNVYEQNNEPDSYNPDTYYQHLKPTCNETETKSGQKLKQSETVVSVEQEDVNMNSVLDIEAKNNGKKITIRPRSGITCCEGCLYCIFLWIPVLAILWLFHEYVLKDYIPEKFSLRRLIWSDKNVINESYFRLTLADLGF